MCVQLNHLAVHLKLTQPLCQLYFKQTIFSSHFVSLEKNSQREHVNIHDSCIFFLQVEEL